MIKNVLVVDDSDNTCKLLKLMLETAGFSVSTDTSPLNALQNFSKKQEARPDIIIVDSVMPEMSGFDFIDKVKGEHSDKKIPVLMLTARRNYNDIIEGYKKGVDYYITKPTDKTQLLYAIGMFEEYQSER